MNNEMTETEIEEKLAAVFPYNSIKWRVATTLYFDVRGALIVVVPYITSRAIQDRLDEVFGVFGWQDQYRETPNGMICDLTVKYKDKQITKSDGAADIRRFPVKGVISDALKRAAVKFKIGRYLYSLKEFKINATVFPSYPSDEDWKKFDNIFKKEDDKNNKFWIAWDYPELPVWATEITPDELQNLFDEVANAQDLESLQGAFNDAYTALKINNLKSKLPDLVKAKNEAKALIIEREEKAAQKARKDAEEKLEESIVSLNRYCKTKNQTSTFCNTALQELDGYPDLQQRLKAAADAQLKTLKA